MLQHYMYSAYMLTYIQYHLHVFPSILDDSEMLLDYFSKYD